MGFGKFLRQGLADWRAGGDTAARQSGTPASPEIAGAGDPAPPAVAADAGATQDSGPLTDATAPARPEARPARAPLAEQVVAMLRTVFDPEIPVNIYDLGLIYDLEVEPASGHVRIRMTLTAPGCPVAQSFPEQVAATVGLIEGVEEVEVELVWEPPWTRERMSQAARLELGML